MKFICYADQPLTAAEIWLLRLMETIPSHTGHSGHCSVRLQDMEACLMIFIIRSVKIGNGAD